MSLQRKAFRQIGHVAEQVPVLVAGLAVCVMVAIFVLVLALTSPREKPAVPTPSMPNCAPFDCSIGGPHR